MKKPEENHTPTPKGKFLIDLCVRLDVAFLWSSGLMLIRRDGVEEVVREAIKEGFEVYGFDAFDIGNDFVHPWLLYADFTKDDLPDEERDPLACISGWPDGIWVEITGVAPQEKT